MSPRKNSEERTLRGTSVIRRLQLGQGYPVAPKEVVESDVMPAKAPVTRNRSAKLRRVSYGAATAGSVGCTILIVSERRLRKTRKTKRTIRNKAAARKILRRIKGTKHGK